MLSKIANPQFFWGIEFRIGSLNIILNKTDHDINSMEPIKRWWLLKFQGQLLIDIKNKRNNNYNNKQINKNYCQFW